MACIAKWWQSLYPLLQLLSKDYGSLSKHLFGTSCQLPTIKLSGEAGRKSQAAHKKARRQVKSLLLAERENEGLSSAREAQNEYSGVFLLNGKIGTSVHKWLGKACKWLGRCSISTEKLGDGARWCLSGWCTLDAVHGLGRFTQVTCELLCHLPHWPNLWEAGKDGCKW